MKTRRMPAFLLAAAAALSMSLSAAALAAGAADVHENVLPPAPSCWAD